MKKYLIALLAVCLMFTGCGVSKVNENKGKQKESTKIESTEEKNDDLKEKSINDSSKNSVGENSTESTESSTKTHAVSSAGEEIEIPIELPGNINVEVKDENNETSSTTYSMISSTNVMSEDAGHDGAIPPTLELRDDMTFTLNHNSTENIVGTYEKTDNSIICTNNSDKYIFIDNGDGTLNFNGKDSSSIEKKNDNEYEIKDGSLFFSN